MVMSKLIGHILLTKNFEYDDDSYEPVGFTVGNRLYRTEEDAKKAQFEENKAKFQKLCAQFSRYPLDFTPCGFRGRHSDYTERVLKTRELLAPAVAWRNKYDADAEDFQSIFIVDPSNLTDADYRFLFDTWTDFNLVQIHEVYDA